MSIKPPFDLAKETFTEKGSLHSNLIKTTFTGSLNDKAYWGLFLYVPKFGHPPKNKSFEFFLYLSFEHSNFREFSSQMGDDLGESQIQKEKCNMR